MPLLPPPPKMSDPPKIIPPINEWTVATLKEHIEKMISDRDIAVRTAVIELERRHETFAAQIEKNIESVKEELKEGMKPKWSVWIPAMVLLMGVIGVTWSLAVTPIQQEIKHIQDRLNESQRSFQQRLHQHDELLQQRAPGRRSELTAPP